MRSGKGNPPPTPRTSASALTRQQLSPKVTVLKEQHHTGMWTLLCLFKQPRSSTLVCADGWRAVGCRIQNGRERESSPWSDSQCDTQMWFGPDGMFAFLIMFCFSVEMSWPAARGHQLMAGSGCSEASWVFGAMGEISGELTSCTDNSPNV